MATTQKARNSRFDPYAAVTDRIVAALERGTVPWRQPWRALGQQANVVSRKPYRGVNQLILPLLGYESRWWLTFKQLKELGGRIAEGQSRRAGGPGPALVCFYRVYKRRHDETGEEERRFVLRAYSVWNSAQVSGLPDWLVAEPTAQEPVDPIPECEALVERYLADGGPELAYGGDRAFYDPARDHIQLPPAARFDTRASFYATAYHELVHSTGAQHRLARAELAPAHGFGSDPYAREELIAEIGAAMLCAATRIDCAELGENSASYMAHWLGALRGDSRLVVAAASKGQRAADMIRGVGYDDAAPATSSSMPAQEGP